MSQKEINFSYNWNKKLNCNSFTTVRLWNPQKYVIGNIYNINLCGNHLKKGQIIGIKKVRLDQFNEFIAHLDTGYSLLEFTNILKRMYAQQIKQGKDVFMLILIKTVNEKS